MIENSIIGLRSIIGPGVTIRDSILMGADLYEGKSELDQDRLVGRPPIGIGAGCVIEGAIIDKNCHIGREVRIVNEGKMENSEGDSDTCMIRDGIPIVLKEGCCRTSGRWRGERCGRPRSPAFFEKPGF